MTRDDVMMRDDVLMKVVDVMMRDDVMIERDDADEWGRQARDLTKLDECVARKAKAEVAKAEAAETAAGDPRPTRPPYRRKSDADFAEEAARKKKRPDTEGVAPPVPLQTRDTNASGSSAPSFSPAPGWSYPSAPSSPVVRQSPVGVSEGHGAEPRTETRVTLKAFWAARDLADWRPPAPPRKP